MLAALVRNLMFMSKPNVKDKSQQRRMADRRSSFGEYKGSYTNYDEPPYSRLFIVGSRQLTEDDFRDAFSRFGEIEEIWVVKDRQTGERKGVTYIKYTRTSDAARAMEAMNGKVIGNQNRHIKVMIASSRDKGSTREVNEEEKVLRLFVIIPKSMTDTELYEIFKQYGDIDYATIIRDKETKESKGFAYVKYYRFSHAATAFEQCDRKFKPVFAEPRRPNVRNDSLERNSSSSNNAFEALTKSVGMLPPTDIINEGYTRLQVIASPQLNQDQLWKLFDVVPSMDFCQVRFEGRPKATRCIATVVYSNPQWAAYAREKLHGFEYPPGQRLIIKPDYDSRSLTSKHAKPDILQIAETITQASNLIQAAGLSPDILQAKLGLAASSYNKDTESLCSVKLPEPKPLASIDDETAARCFIVCTPQPPPVGALRDVFCRFGDLIDVYMLANRNCGYAKYGSRKSAEDAIKTLHGCEIYGIRVKVMEAEERPEYNRKRLRLDDGPA